MKKLTPDGRRTLHHGISSHGLRPGELINEEVVICTWTVKPRTGVHDTLNRFELDY